MSAGLPRHLQHVVEDICNAGCQRVYEIIDRLDKDDVTVETQQLSSVERAQVLVELRHIMSVYEHR